MPLIPSNQPPYYTIENTITTLLTLTNAQIKALPTTAIQLIQAPGTGRAIYILGGVLKTNFTVEYATAATDDVIKIRYTTLGSLFNIANDLTTSALDSFLTGTGNLWYPLIPYTNLYKDSPDWKIGIVGALATPENKAVQIDATSAGNFTLGDAANTLNIKLWWTIINL